MRNMLLRLIIIICAVNAAFCLYAQPGTTVELKKPKKYESRTLASEKSDTKKFGKVRHGYQNMITHYNYFFNANNSLNDVVNKAKAFYKDDYTRLLSFYNYTLTSTAQSKTELDSVIYHCTAGVLLHDLRNDWIDDLYFLLGKAYYYRKNFDSSLNAFQFINYAWAQKDDGYDLPIGSNATNTDGTFSIATKEKKGIVRKALSTPPVRNGNFLWMARVSIDSGNTSRAAGLLEILRHDPLYPERLQTSLHETLAYLFYHQKRYDSAAYNLSLALNNATDRFEKARWEYLIGQLFHLAGDDAQAIEYFGKSAAHTPDPIMEVNAYMNSITLSNDSTGNATQQKLDALLKLAKRDKYVMYRDIIYYAAAQVQLQIGNKEAAKESLFKSIKASEENPEQKGMSFLMLADINYDDKEWISSHNFYDSSKETGGIKDSASAERLLFRNPPMATIATNLIGVNNEDSLQQLAALPEAQRTTFLKKELRRIRRAQGLKVDENGEVAVNPAVQLQTQADLFNNPSASKEWYFNNNALKSSGFGSFRQQWGNRPNIDNWRRQSEIDKVGQAVENKAALDSANDATATAQDPALINTVKDLEAGLPLTEEKVKLSNTNIAKALFNSGVVFQNTLENYPAAIDMYQELNRRNVDSQYREPALFNLYYCYTKLGKKYQADSAMALLKKGYPKSKLMEQLTKSGKAPSESSSSTPATKKYQEIYNQFIEGNFAEAKKQKAAADSVYGDSYWTPQLLYIESIYYVSEREDSAAINRLVKLQQKFVNTPLADKATTMIDVLKRRKQIEQYLTNLQITRNEDTSENMVINLNPVNAATKAPVNVKLDSIINKPVMNKPVMKMDSARTVRPPDVAQKFNYNAADSQFVVIVMDKVAPVYANEAKNAFNRYNKEKFYNIKLDVSQFKLDDRFNIVLIGLFTDALAAVGYTDKIRPQTAGKILPWLTADKYSYLMISRRNLALLQENKDMQGYKDLIQKALPGKF